MILHDELHGQYEVWVYDLDLPTQEEVAKSIRLIISCPTLEATLAAQRLRDMFPNDDNH